MNSPLPIVIVGGGLAGLSCALRLTDYRIPCVVVEATDRVGGRVATDVVDGFRLDRGFQVLQTAYPEARRMLDYDALNLRQFSAGAIVRRGGRFHAAYDPLRHPSETIRSATTPLVSPADKIRLLKLWAEVRLHSPDGLLETGVERTTEQEWIARGFSKQAVDTVLRPFFAGVFLQPELSTSSRFFRFTFRMFADGHAAVPALGMGTIPGQLANRLTAAGASIRLNTKVAAVTDAGVSLVTGEFIPARAVVVATELPQARTLLGDLPETAAGPVKSAWTIYFAADRPVVGEPTLVLNGDGPADGPINHLAEMSAASADYAPAGKTLIAASVVDPVAATRPSVVEDVRRQIARWVGPIELRHLRSYEIPFALPPLDPPTMNQSRRPVQIHKNVFVCGDHRDQPSTNGALASGRRTADEIIESEPGRAGPMFRRMN